MTPQRLTEESNLLYFCQKNEKKDAKKWKNRKPQWTTKPKNRSCSVHKNEKPTQKMAEPEKRKIPTPSYLMSVQPAFICDTNTFCNNTDGSFNCTCMQPWIHRKWNVVHWKIIMSNMNEFKMTSEETEAPHTYNAIFLQIN